MTQEKGGEGSRRRINQIEAELATFTVSIRKGIVSVIASLISGLVALFAIIIFDTRSVFTGTHFVVMVAILAGTVIVYFSFVFGRRAKLLVELSNERKKLEISSGRKA